MTDIKEQGWFSRHRTTVVVISIILILVGAVSYFLAAEQVFSQLKINATSLESQLVQSTKDLKEASNQDILNIKASFINSAFGTVSVTIDSAAFYASTEGSQKDFIYSIAKTYNAVCKANGLRLGCKTTVYSDSGRVIATGAEDGTVKIY